MISFFLHIMISFDVGSVIKKKKTRVVNFWFPALHPSGLYLSVKDFCREGVYTKLIT